MTVILGMQSISQSLATNKFYSGNNVYLSERWTNPHTFTISGISLYSSGTDWDGSVYIGIQGNNGGVPDNLYITSGIMTFNSGNAGSWRHLPLQPIVSLTSGTIYHTVIQPSGTIGNGSTIGLRMSGFSSISVFHPRLIGSLFNTAINTDFQLLLSYDSGNTWNAGSVPALQKRPRLITYRESGGLIGGLQEIGITYLNITTEAAFTDTKLVGALYKLDKTYNISGIFTRALNTIGNIGSMWCRLEYSGVMADGKRTEIGSILFNLPLVSTFQENSTPQFFAELHEGSIIYIWLYGSGIITTNFNTTVSPYGAGSGTFGLGSASYMESSDNGSTISFDNFADLSIYFADSGAEPAGIGNLYNLGNSFGGQFNFYG